MPRSVLVLLLASLIGNAALILVVTRRAPADQPTSSSSPHSSASRINPDKRPTSTAHPEPGPDAALSPEVAAILNSRDPARLHALLLAAGVDEELRHMLVQSAIWKNNEARFKALGGDDEETATEIWWKEPGGARRYDSPEQRARNRAMNLLHKEIGEEFSRITGTDPDAFNPEENTWLARKYGGLPRDKAEALHRIDRDYDELLGEIGEETNGFELPTDVEKRRLIEAEREKDLAALLSPEERVAWEMRNSPTAETLRYRMTQLDATEEEYRRIYALQKAFDAEFDQSSRDPFAPAVPDDDDTFWERREAAEKLLEAGIRATVGEERYAAAARENDQDYTSARAAAERLGLPPDTATAIVAVREPAAAESRRIAADTSLTLEQKKAALARLAADTRAEVVRTLGPEAAEAYFQRGAMRWLDPLENGRTITFEDDHGGGYDTRDLDDGETTSTGYLQPAVPVSSP